MKKREFELKIGLNITEDNYEDLIEIYNKALKNKSKRFPFRNSEDKLYAIETEYLTFVLETLDKIDHNELDQKSEEYKIIEKKLTKEEFEDRQKKMLESHNEGDDDKIFTFDKIKSNKNKTK